MVVPGFDSAGRPAVILGEMIMVSRKLNQGPSIHTDQAILKLKLLQSAQIFGQRQKDLITYIGKGEREGETSGETEEYF